MSLGASRVRETSKAQPVACLQCMDLTNLHIAICVGPTRGRICGCLCVQLVFRRTLPLAGIACDHNNNNNDNDKHQIKTKNIMNFISPAIMMCGVVAGVVGEWRDEADVREPVAALCEQDEGEEDHGQAGLQRCALAR